MNYRLLKNQLKIEYLILFLVLILGIYITFIPRFDYPYPIHLDEWFDIACANQIFSQASAASLSDPFSGGGPILYQSAEVGFHLVLGIFQRITGLDWIIIFRFLPSIIFVFTILGAYLMAKRLGFGLEAAFFVSLLPTSLGILGPAFLVPVATGLLFICLSLFILYHVKSWWSPVILTIFITYLLSSHAYTAIAIFIVVVPYLAFRLKEDWKFSTVTFFSIALPFLVSLPFVWNLVKPYMEGLTTLTTPSPYIDYPYLLGSLGFLTVGSCLLGIYYLLSRREKTGYGLVAGFLVLLVLLVLYWTFHLGLDGFYERSLLYVMLLTSIIAGAGLVFVRHLSLPERISNRLGSGWLSKYFGPALCLILVSLIVATVIPERQNTDYYHMIDDTDYQTFTWINENVVKGDQKAVLDPWKGTAFTAITGIKVLSRITMAPKELDNVIYALLEEGCNDTDFLVNNDISLIYTREEVSNPDLVRMGNYVYLLDK